MSKNEVKAKMSLTRKEASVYLDSLAYCFKNGSLQIQCNDRQIHMKPEDTVNMDIEVEVKKDIEKIIISLCWKNNSDNGMENNK